MPCIPVDATIGLFVLCSSIVGDLTTDSGCVTEFIALHGVYPDVAGY